MLNPIRISSRPLPDRVIIPALKAPVHSHRVNGAHAIVLVRNRHAEDGHDRVPDGLLHDAYLGAEFRRQRWK